MQKRILMLGASCFFTDTYQYAKDNDLYAVAVDLRDEEFAIRKKMADASHEDCEVAA